jgi:hypothetical protein
LAEKSHAQRSAISSLQLTDEQNTKMEKNRYDPVPRQNYTSDSDLFYHISDPYPARHQKFRIGNIGQYVKIKSEPKWFHEKKMTLVQELDVQK